MPNSLHSGARSMPRRLAAMLALLLLPASLRADPPTLLRLSMEPPQVELRGQGARQQLLVTGHFSDGSVRDVTRSATWTVAPAAGVHIDQGVLIARVDGTAQVKATLQGVEASTTIRTVNVGKVAPLSFKADVMPILSK